MSLCCDHCEARGHNKQTCLKLNGYPKWYKTMQEGKWKIPQKQTAYLAENKNEKAVCLQKECKR